MAVRPEDCISHSYAHICSPGSTFISGNIDPEGNKYGLKAHGFCVGFGGTWQEAFQDMITHLKYPDAGGITISHPTWFSQLTDDHVLEMLDFDKGVLGIEIYEVEDDSGERLFLQPVMYKASAQ